MSIDLKTIAEYNEAQLQILRDQITELKSVMVEIEENWITASHFHGSLTDERMQKAFKK